MKILKKLLSAVLASTMVIGMSIGAFAAEDIQQTSATFDLTASGKQVIHTVDADGNDVEICAERIHKPTMRLFKKNHDLDYGTSTWKIWFKSVTSNAGFYMDININNDGIATITDAYDGYYFLMPFNVSTADLKIIRDKETSRKSARAEYYFEGTLAIGGCSCNGWLRGDVKDMKLKMTMK